MIILLIVGLIKKTLYNMSQYFPKPYRNFGGNIALKVDLSNYATKTDLKNATGVDTSELAAKSDLASLKAEIDKIDVYKLKTVPIDLSKLSNVVNNDAVNKAVYGKLVTKANNIITSRFVLEIKYGTDKSDLKKKLRGRHKTPDTNGIAKKHIIMLKLLK